MFDFGKTPFLTNFEAQIYIAVKFTIDATTFFRNFATQFMTWFRLRKFKIVFQATLNG